MRRIEGAVKVSGALMFTEDMELSGLLHAKLVLSYAASAEIASVRAEAARALPGVVAVVTGADLGLTEDHPDQPMAARRVFYSGQPVAAVLATSAAVAADAAGMVEVEYSPLPAALGVEAAVAEGAPRVLPEQTGDADEASIHGAASSEETQTRSRSATSRAGSRPGAATWRPGGRPLPRPCAAATSCHACTTPTWSRTWWRRGWSATAWSPSGRRPRGPAR